MQPAAIVINSSLTRDLGRFRRRCREAAAGGGWEPSFLETTLDDRGVGLAGAAVAAGARMVVAAGGDGTVRACAQALAGTQVPLAIVPLGTANLAARALGIPPGIGGSLAAAFGGHERRIDLAVAGAAAGADGAGTRDAGTTGGAGGLTFAAMAGIGLDAEVVAATPRLLKRPAGWLRVAHRVLTGSSRDGRQLERHQARRVEIRAGTELPREVDGEVITPGRSLTVTLLRRALTVRVPPPGG